MPETPQILIVEDDPIVRDYLRQLLDRLNYKTLAADCGSKAIAYLKISAVDLALLDIGLPDMSGYDIMAFIKDNCPALPVIAMTGDSSVESAVEAFKKGSYDYLEKPFKSDKLCKTIENALTHSRLERDRKQAELRFRESEAKYHQLFDAVSDALMVIDASTLQVEEVNRAALDLYGYTREEFLTLTIFNLSTEKEKTASVWKKLKDEDLTGGYLTLRYFKKKDGTIFQGEVSFTIVTRDNRQKMIAATRDITDRPIAVRPVQLTSENPSENQHLATEDADQGR
jgi:PAS domain S-box-containing protein